MLAAVLALASSVTWGLADFMGGLQSRRHALLAVLLVSQVVALVLVVVAVLAGADTGHDARATAWAVGGAALGLGALIAFYRALSIGTMSVVAPISATAVAIPVLAGILFSGERPGALQYAGIALAAGGVVLVARHAPDEDADMRRAGRAAVGLAIIAAIGFGSFFASVDRAEETADVAWVLLVQRSVDVGLLLAACAIVRPHVPRAPAALAAIAAIGVFDLAGQPALHPRHRPRTAQRRRPARLALPGRHGDPRPVRALRADLAHAGRRGGRDAPRRGRARGGLASGSGTSSALHGSMSEMRRFLPIAILLALLVLPGAASASSRQVTSFEAPGALLRDSERESTLDEIQRMGVAQIRQLVYWRQFSAQPNSKRAPQFDAANPDKYPAGTWDLLDRLVDSTTRRGMQLQLTVTGPVPKWATKRKRGHIGDPSPRLFGRWVRAVVARYGSRVNLWSIWNEPNHPDFLGPQYRHGSPHTPKLYRKLYVAGDHAIHATAGNERDVVLFGETAPIGNQNVVSPLGFLRGALCLNSAYKAKGSCKKLRMDGYAHHAYTRKAGPTFVSEDPDEVSIGSLRRLTSALDKAARAGRVNSGVGIYLTEYGVQSYPDKIAGVTPRRQAEYLAISERMATANPRVQLFSQYLMKDDEPRKGRTALERFSGFETGLRTYKGKRKPAYNGFMLPLAVTEYGSSDVLWGRVRPALGATQVEIQRKVGKRGWSRVRMVTTSGTYGLKTAHKAGEVYRARWTRPDGSRLTGPKIRPY